MTYKNYEELFVAGNMTAITEGDSRIYYKNPKIRDFFLKRFSHLDSPAVLELGAGEGMIFDLICEKMNCGSYTLTDASPTAVKKLRKRLAQDKSVFIQELDVKSRFPFRDNQFDIVCCFDLMHHVTPYHAARRMADEMMRVSKKYVLLIEANGISIIRRIGELPPQARNLGESSYFPWEYKKIFMDTGGKFVTITPFNFFMPPRISRRYLKPFISISELGAKIPFLKWQSQSLEIYCEK